MTLLPDDELKAVRLRVTNRFSLTYEDADALLRHIDALQEQFDEARKALGREEGARNRACIEANALRADFSGVNDKLAEERWNAGRLQVQLEMCRKTRAEVTEILRKAREFVDRHSEPWYISGQALLSEIDAAIGPLPLPQMPTPLPGDGE